MATLQQIDPQRPLTFVGMRYEKTDDPEMARLAEAMQMPQLQIIANAVTPYVELSAADGAALLAYLPNTAFVTDFAENLQCIAQTTEGEPLLTGWMPLERFREFIAHRQADTPAAPLSALDAMMTDWAGIDIAEIYFDGFRL
ncbi:hypothetical protein RHDC4_00746 [Rhodocyclaceae bacterium]|nr:hypothetical protein RHDC4_00746 [Rhodocyclaceae bacterium]